MVAVVCFWPAPGSRKVAHSVLRDPDSFVRSVSSLHFRFWNLQIGQFQRKYITSKLGHPRTPVQGWFQRNQEASDHFAGPPLTRAHITANLLSGCAGPSEQRFFSQMMDFSFVGNSQKLREGTCAIHCVPRSPAKPLRVAR